MVALSPHVVAEVDRHPVQPRLVVALQFHLSQAPIEPQEHLLRGVLGILDVAEQPQRGHQHQALVLPHDRLERGQIARARSGIGAVHRLCHRQQRQGRVLS